MSTRSWELLVSLLSHPNSQESPVVLRAAQRILGTEQGETQIRFLAEQSPARAREVLTRVENLMNYWELEPLQKAIDTVEERIEGQKLALAPDDELQARATLHVLMHPEADGMGLRTRILAWALHERHPELAASVLLHLGEEHDFWDDTDTLRRTLLVRLRDDSPDLALSLLSHHTDTIEWLHRLLENQPCNEALFGSLVNRLKGYGYWHGVTWEMLLELARRTLERQASVAVALLTGMADWLRTTAEPRRGTRMAELFSLCQQVPLEKRRELGEYLRAEIANILPKPERRLFLRRLTHWLRPELQGAEDPLQRDLQADRAAALLMHLPIRRLAKAHLWQTDLASRQRRRFMRRRNQLWQQYLQRRKAVLELAATLDSIAAQKTNE